MISMADMGAEMKMQDIDTPGTEESDAFEDAPDTNTPRAKSVERTSNGHANSDSEAVGATMDGTREGASSGLGIKNIGEDAAFDHGPDQRLPSRTQKSPRDRSVSPSQHLRGLSGDFAVRTPPPPSTVDRARAL